MEDSVFSLSTKNGFWDYMVVFVNKASTGFPFWLSWVFSHYTMLA